LIIQLDEAKRTLNGVRPAIEELRHALRIEELARQIEELEAKTLIPDFWSRPDSGKILQSIKDKKSTIEAYEALCAKRDDTLVLCDMGIEENDGLVTPRSAEFGNYRGDALEGSVSHGELVDFFAKGKKRKRVLEFYKSVAKELEVRGR